MGAVVDGERRDGDHEVGPRGDGVAGAGAGLEAPVGDGLPQPPPEPRLAGERRLACVDAVDDGGVDVAADDLVAGPGDLRGQRQPDLAEGDDDSPHAATSTLSPVCALRSTLSAQTTVA